MKERATGYAHLISPTSLEYVTDSSGQGHLWVAYAGNQAGNLNQGYIKEIDPSTGNVLNTIDSGTFACVVGLSRVPGDPNHLYVADEGGNFHSRFGPGAIYEVNINPNDPPNFGTYTTVSGGSGHKGGFKLDANYDISPYDGRGNLVDVVLDSTTNMNLYVPQTGDSGQDGSIAKVELTDQDGTQTIVAEDATGNNGPYVLGQGVDGGVWDPSLNINGTVTSWVINDGTAPTIAEGHLTAVDPNTGIAYRYTNDNADNPYIATPGGMIIYSTSGGLAPTALLVNQTQTINAGMAPAATLMSSASVSSQDQPPPLPISSSPLLLPRDGPNIDSTLSVAITHGEPPPTLLQDAFFAQWASTPTSVEGSLLGIS